jgi:energy-coupling factor transport system ATP-binding protein
MTAREWGARPGETDPAETLPLTPRDGYAWLAAHPLPAERKPVGETVDKNGSVSGVKKQRPVLSAREVWFRYNRDDADILRGLSIDLYSGEIHAVLGGNGTGKSTLLSLLRGLLHARRGRVVSAYGLEKPSVTCGRRSGVVLLGADPRALFVHETVRRELTETAPEHTGTLEQLVRAFGLDALLDRHPMDLSSGEGQKVALAMALSRDPDVLLLDEPTRGLDPAARETLQGILRGLAQEGRAVLMVTHDVEFAATAADTCSLLFDGEIVSSGPPAAFFAGNRFYTTAANRMARAWRPEIVTVEDLLTCWGIAPADPEAVSRGSGGLQ